MGSEKMACLCFGVGVSAENSSLNLEGVLFEWVWH